MWRRKLQTVLKRALVDRLYFSTAPPKIKEVDAVNNIRNIGILAHIDAGKTTTTERMLYYSGTIRQMGEVHHGNTVTDYMDQERERGITITSAAVTFSWKQHQFNLIDTPGHIDFTMEVERTLSVLDGAVVILDGSAGVEAQTITVWRQAERYKIPKIVFANKMDRLDSNVEMCCTSIEHKLDVPALCLQKPIYDNKKLCGIIDIVNLKKLVYNSKSNQVDYAALSEANDGKVWEKTLENRAALVDKLSEYNDVLANQVIASESLDAVSAEHIVSAVKAATCSHKIVPVLCGSSYKNIGVQPLMDAIILYLPSPLETSQHYYAHFEQNLCAKVFKVIHDKQRGPLVFFRIYTGTFNKAQKIYNFGQDRSEQTGRLYIAYADDFKEAEKITRGNIAVVTGLKDAMTGDLVTSSPGVAQKIKKRLTKELNIDDDGVLNALGVSTTIPEPVFFCSIEPPSLAYQTALDQALADLQREDPSLRVTHEEDTGQTILAGMGELHLEIIKDRILKEYKVDAELGPLRIAYRESPLTKVTGDLTQETKIGSSKQFVVVRLSLLPTEKPVKDVLRLDKSQEAASNLAHVYHKHLMAVRQGIEVALYHGPKINSPIINVEVMLHHLEVGRGTSESIITATVTQLVQKLLHDSGTVILEPIMCLEVVVPDEYSSGVLADLSRRRCGIEQIDIRGTSKVVRATAPLAELMGYSTLLRTITSGTGSFTMEFYEYRKMASNDEARAVESVRGF